MATLMPCITGTNLRVAGVSTVFIEVMYSHVLFFGRDERSKLIGEQLGYDRAIIAQVDNFFSRYGRLSERQLQRFNIYGSRLLEVHERMNEWRPQQLRDLWVRPYRDPVAFYAFWFAAFIGVFTVLSVGLSVAQTYATFKALSP
jgi:hypothetical protein